VDKTTGKLLPMAIPERLRAQISAAPAEMLASPAE
jgi:hypothetical protein